MLRSRCQQRTSGSPVDFSNFTYESITSAEFDRQKALYGPLTQAVRELLDAVIRTQADDDTIRRAQAAIESVTAELRTEQLDGPYGVQFAADGRGQACGNAATGLRNAIAPPLTINHEPDGSTWAEFSLGAAYEGPPGHVHGGVAALVLDQLLGETASGGVRPTFTGTITCRYLRGTPLGALRAHAKIDRVEGAKTFASGALCDADGSTVQAHGVFILPTWARAPGFTLSPL